MKLRAWLVCGVLVVASVMGAASCTSYEIQGELAGGEPCSERPWDCMAEYTCGIGKAGVVCLVAQDNGEGENCASSVNTPGCGHDLLCIEVVGVSGAHCRQFCDPHDSTRGCPDDWSCTPTTLTLNDKPVGSVSVCIPP
jgi:hypothetical protein